jgi:hypothetical protein
MVFNLMPDPFRVDGLIGFRYADLQEDLDIAHFTVPIPPFGGTFAVFNGNQILLGETQVVNDVFHTHNQFYGGQLGLRAETRFGNWILNGTVKVALGSTRQIVDISGGSALTTTAGTTSLPGGVLSQVSNIGRFKDNEFSVIPEAGVNLGYQLTEGLRVYVGYNFLYWTNVVRPGSQLDGVVDDRQAPTSPFFNPTFLASRPAVDFSDTDIWVQGINAGLEFRF